MRVACLTMVWKDQYFLDLWVRYYGALFGRGALYVLSHGGEPEVAEVAQGCNIINIPRDAPDEMFDEIRWNLLSDFASGLTRYYDRVLVGDVDELILSLDPTRPLPERLAERTLGPVSAPAGYELYPEDEAVMIAPDRPILQQCFKGVLSATYSKPGILSAPARLTAGGHGCTTPFELLPDLALLHLRFLNTPAQVERRKARMEIAAAASEGAAREENAFLRGWRKAERIREKIGRQFANAPEVASPLAPERARKVLENARKKKAGAHLFSVPQVRDQDFRIVLDPGLRDLF